MQYKYVTYALVLKSGIIETGIFDQRQRTQWTLLNDF
ncbi:hypothetical protein DEV92_10465 [Phyllobacterium myrsinacearum]|nr:hypothetical protein DEV92_10465 [Phyllobacterium myrsinacearum]RZV05003.1 hypothetical protein EV654_3812 [Phyllobacterium myrsinacearum]